MTKKIKIEDNFLEQEKFDEIELMIDPTDFAWYLRVGFYDLSGDHWKSYTDSKGNDLDKFQFTHTFYEDAVTCSPHMKKLNSILDLLQPVVIYRIRANLLTRLPNIVENTFHVDIENVSEERLKQWTTSIFYVNTNNGYTLFEDGTKVESVANRMLTFPANLKHTGTTCTDQQIRIVINFNYYLAQSTTREKNDGKKTNIENP